MSKPFGVVGHFGSPAEIVRAADAVRKAGYTRFDSYTPFPVHGLNEAMGMRDTILPWIVLGMGFIGCLTGYALQTWTMETAYPFVVSGKPLFSLPAFIPVMFELTILFSAFGAVFGMLHLNRLPRHYHPLFKYRAFANVTRDRFYIAVESSDPKYDSAAIQALLKQLGAQDIKEIEE